MQKDRFLIIRAYYGGMGSLLEHVVNSLIYAELTERIPIVFWNTRCLYYEPQNEKVNCSVDNAFEYFFNPVSNYSVKDIRGKNYTYYPSDWDDHNIINDSILTKRKPRPCTRELFESNANVLVAEYALDMDDLHSWIPADHPLKTKSKEELWCKFFQQKMQVRESIIGQINTFYDLYLRDQHVLGVHLRKTDKTFEQAMPSDKQYINAMNSYLSSFPNAKILFATDCQRTLEKFKNIYKTKMIHTECIRSTNSAALHTGVRSSKKLLGEQILIDMYLLSKCSFFIGAKRTNVSRTVLYMLNNPNELGRHSILLHPGTLEKVYRQILVWPTWWLGRHWRQVRNQGIVYMKRLLRMEC